MLKRLRLKFIFINMAIVAVMLCVIFGTIYQLTKANLERESLRMMEQIAAQPFRLGRPGSQPEEVRLPFFTLQLGSEGQTVAAGGGYYDLSDAQFLADITECVFRAGANRGVLPEYALRYGRFHSPEGELLVFADMSSETATLNSLLNTSLGIGGASFLLFLGISMLLARWAVKPVETAWKQQKQFVADASHELKTPLTVILTNAELLCEADCAAPARAQFGSHILTMAQHMRSLVEQLLELARADGGTEARIDSDVDLSRTVSEALLPFEALFFEKELALDSRVEAQLHVRGSEAELRQTVEILLDNAQKYAAPGGQVSVSLTRHGRGKCLLCVSNPGEALSAAELQNIFKRFYRGDEARGRTGSFGLGLAIAQSVVLRHRGRIWAESQNGRNSFFVELPTAANPKSAAS